MQPRAAVRLSKVRFVGIDAPLRTIQAISSRIRSFFLKRTGRRCRNAARRSGDIRRDDRVDAITRAPDIGNAPEARKQAVVDLLDARTGIVGEQEVAVDDRAGNQARPAPTGTVEGIVQLPPPVLLHTLVAPHCAAVSAGLYNRSSRTRACR